MSLFYEARWRINDADDKSCMFDEESKCNTFGRTENLFFLIAVDRRPANPLWLTILRSDFYLRGREWFMNFAK